MPATTVIAAALPGWFGKLPGLGDFASRRLPREFIRRWDDWLQRSLSGARDALGPRWHDTYLRAPARRFWIASGVLGDASWAGLLVASRDRVGRHFPLTLAAPLDAGPPGLATALAASDWFRAADAAAGRAIDEAQTTAELDAALDGVGLPSAAPGDAQSGLADALLGRAGDLRCSVWWSGDAGAATPFSCFVALPPPGAFAALLAP
jgi:type VI secretion system protein ImpM